MSAMNPCACAKNGAVSEETLRTLVRVEELVNRFSDLADVLTDLATAAQTNREITPASLSYLSETLGRDARELQDIYVREFCGESV